MIRANRNLVWVRLLPAAWLLATGVACKGPDSSLLDPSPHATGGAGAGGASAGGASAGGAAGHQPGVGIGFWSAMRQDGCYSAGFPTPDMRPAPTDTTDVGVIYMAIDKLRLGGQDPTGAPSVSAWETIGFDLDGVCTDSGTQGMATDACSVVEEQSCKSSTSKIPPDGANCRDNTFGRFWGDVSHTEEIAKYRLNDDLFNCALCVGYFTFIIKITGYNGTANDDQVRVDLYPSPGLQKPFPLDCMGTAWKSGDLCWVDDPANRWKIDPGAFASPMTGADLPNAKLSDAAAYMRDGYLVMQLPDPALLWFPTQPGIPVNALPLVVHRGTLAARMQKDAGAWRLTDGTIGARSGEKEVVNAFRQVGFCEADPLYSVMTSQVHGALDILQSGMSDVSISCDSLSIGIGFSARQATPGPTEKVVPLTECVDHFAAGGASGAGGKAGAGG